MSYSEEEVMSLLRQQRDSDAQQTEAHSSVYGGQLDQNLIQWQLDLKEDLERIDHLLRGHELKYTANGELIWQESDNPDAKPFNQYGTSLLLNCISFYLNRNTILSNYDEKMINDKMHDLGDELADLIFMKYEKMGMDTAEKKKLYPIIVREIVDTIHSAYLRALGGGERDSLRTARSVVQNQPISSGHEPYPSLQPQKKFSLFRPTTWK